MDKYRGTVGLRIGWKPHIMKEHSRFRAGYGIYTLKGSFPESGGMAGIQKSIFLKMTGGPQQLYIRTR